MNKNIIVLIVGLLVVGGVVYFVSNNKKDDTTTETSNQAIVTSGENPQPGSTVHDLPVEPAAVEARKDLAVKLSIGEKSIVIMQITETTWNDGCLGLGGPAESCLQALVPGFKVEMLAKGKTYFYRTDKTGTVVRSETNMSTTQGTQNSSQASISSLNPTSGKNNSVVTVMGTGFDVTKNKVHFGGVVIPSTIPSENNGTKLTFSIPSSKIPECAYTDQCPYSTTPFSSGTYMVSIETPQGVTNSLPFKIISSQ